MDYRKYYRNLFLFFTTFSHVYCNTAEGETYKYTETLTTESSTKITTPFLNVPSVTLARPKHVKLTMDEESEVLFDYNIPCNGVNNLHIIEIESGNPELFSVKGNPVFHITCDDADFTNKHLNDTNRSLSDTTEETTTIDARLLAIEGSVKVTLKGILLGVGTLKVKVKGLRSNVGFQKGETLENRDVTEDVYKFHVDVIRVLRPIDQAFRVIVACFITVVITGFGCSLDIEVVKECLKKPIAPGLGLACQYILMPLIGFAVAKIVPIDDRAITFGIFVCGTCPGGGSSNVYSFLLGGDINLSITMTCISTVESLGLMPLWVYTLGRQFLDDDFHVVIPYEIMLQTLAMITIPLFVGLAFKHKFPKAAVKFVKILKPVTVVMMLIFLVIGIISNLYIFLLIRPIYLVAGGLLPYIGYVTGGLVALLFRQPWTRVKTIAIETGMQNTKVAFLMMVNSFPEPLGDIAAMAPIASSMATPIPAMVVAVPYLLYNRFVKKYETVSDENIDKINEDVPNGGTTPNPDAEVNHNNSDKVVENLTSV